MSVLGSKNSDAAEMGERLNRGKANQLIHDSWCLLVSLSSSHRLHYYGLCAHTRIISNTLPNPLQAAMHKLIQPAQLHNYTKYLHRLRASTFPNGGHQ
jgi:hypothetical protein